MQACPLPLLLFQRLLAVPGGEQKHWDWCSLHNHLRFVFAGPFFRCALAFVTATQIGIFTLTTLRLCTLLPAASVLARTSLQ